VQRLQDLIHRIRWDAEFGKGAFALGYDDRVARQEQTVPFASVSFDRESPGMFSFQDDDGVRRQIPLHRVRTVYKDGAVIWQRPSPSQRDRERDVK
jgi:uncharacterized protein (UPF0248 family)